MALFGLETMRLVRTKWRNAQGLALEIFAILNGETPITTNAPITVTPPPGSTGPGITINMPAGSTDPGVVVTRGGVTTTISDGGGGGGTGGGTDLGTIDFPGQDPADPGTPPAQNTPFTLWGVVVGKAQDDVYQVKCWALDPARNAPIGVLNVTQGLIDKDDEIPTGTPVVVVAFPGTDRNGKRTILAARMQVPVFVPPEAP